MNQQSHQKSGRINSNLARHTASTPSIPRHINQLKKKSEDGYLQIHSKCDPKAGKPLPPNPNNRRHNESITSTQSQPAYINRQHNTFKPPNIPNMNINNNIQPPQLHRPQSNHLQQRNMSMPHPNMPNINRYNTVPPNIYERNSSMPHMQYQSNQIAMQYNNPISPHLPYTNQTFSPSIHSPNDHHHPSYGYIPENRGVIELGQPVISETWETGKK
eukprot:404848_1